MFQCLQFLTLESGNQKSIKDDLLTVVSINSKYINWDYRFK